MDSPKLSIIVPVYNVDKYINKCIESILAQTFTDFELLLVNDGSLDSSGSICDEYEKKDSRIKVFHKENGGVSSARNLGLENARGEWIAFVDGDDWISPEMYKKLL
ncbi:MAG: glycosyltransferase, partial [Bacilli bacterium]